MKCTKCNHDMPDMRLPSWVGWDLYFTKDWHLCKKCLREFWDNIRGDE